MNFDRFLRSLFNPPQPAPTPQRAPQPRPQPPAANRSLTVHPSQAQILLAQKLVGQLRTIDRTYDLRLLGDPVAWAHDVAVMLAYDDLDGVSAEFLDTSGQAFYTHRVRVGGHAGKAQLHSEGGLALPVLDKRRVSKARLLVHRKGRNQLLYSPQLRLQWSGVERAKQESGHAFADTHAQKTTGGRGEATVHVGNSLRVLLTITRSGGKGYAFATDSSGQLSVYCHAQYAPQGFRFTVGSKVTAVLVQVPKGIQAREIRAAA